MPTFPTPHISDRTNQLIDRAVAGFDPELNPFFEIIRRGRPSNGQDIASDLNITVGVALSLYVRAIHAFCDTIRSLDIDEDERKAILRWMSQPRSEEKLMSSQEVFARLSERLNEMDAA